MQCPSFTLRAYVADVIGAPSLSHVISGSVAHSYLHSKVKLKFQIDVQKYLEGLKHNYMYIRRQHLPLSFGDLSVLKTNHPVGNWWSVQLSIEFQLSKNLLQI